MAVNVVEDERKEFKEMELWEHLQELRTRLIRSVIYVGVGLIIAWVLYPHLFDLFMAPLRPVMKERGWKILLTSFTEGFFLRFQVSLIAGLVFTIPAITMELWGFIAPGLTRNERKACRLVFPASIFFFLMGVACGYVLMDVTIQYFAQYIPKDMELMQRPLEYLTFLVKMVVGFGLCFQLPVILMFLAWIGLVTSRLLRDQWRFAVVGCVVLAAAVTPGGDPVTMMIMSAPLALLYLTSIYLCSIVEKMKDRRPTAP